MVVLHVQLQLISVRSQALKGVHKQLLADWYSLLPPSKSACSTLLQYHSTQWIATDNCASAASHTVSQHQRRSIACATPVSVVVVLDPIDDPGGPIPAIDIVCSSIYTPARFGKHLPPRNRDLTGNVASPVGSLIG